MIPQFTGEDLPDGGFSLLPGSKSFGARSDDNQKSFRRIMGIDPGFASTGWGVVDYFDNRFRYIAHGVIETSPKSEHGLRLGHIYNEVCRLTKLYSPTEASMEELFFAKNVSSAFAVAEARGVIQLCFFKANIPCKQFKPNTIKLSVTGTGNAGKELVQQNIRILLGMKDIPKPDHAADALAAAITAANFISSLN